MKIRKRKERHELVQENTRTTSVYSRSQSLDSESLCKEHNNCKKKRGHKKFIPIKDFGMDHIYKSYRNKPVIDLVQSIAQLTVHIYVEKVSRRRPKYFPGTKELYPYSKTCWKPRNGSGRVRLVYEDERGYYKSCPCPQCKFSSNPSKIWWIIEVMTATHVVFDNREALDTICRLFYDSDTSKKVIIQGLSAKPSVERDFCMLSCITCDEDLAHRLDTAIKQLDGYRWRVIQKNKTTGRKRKMAVIVSHPHGSHKHVSIGPWTEMQEKVYGRRIYSKYIYTTCTCPGSSGAFVYIIGAGRFLDEHVHSGATPNANQSGMGFGSFLQTHPSSM